MVRNRLILRSRKGHFMTRPRPGCLAMTSCIIACPSKKWAGLNAATVQDRQRMSRSKESVSLPTIRKYSDGVNSWTERGKKLPKPALPTVQELVVRQSLKRASLWFRTWRVWQQRVFVCRVMEHCSRRQLHILATALEPVLHIDFSSSLVPHLASLHMDGAATFQVQRGMLQRVFSDELLKPETSVAYLPSLPTTLLTSESSSSSKNCSEFTAHNKQEDSGIGSGTPGNCMKGREDRVMLPPVLPLTHVQHAPMSPESSLEDVLALRHTRFSSVPDFRSTTDLLRCIKRKELFKPKLHKRSQSLGSYLHTESKRHTWRQREAVEQFKAQLAAVSQVGAASLCHTISA